MTPLDSQKHLSPLEIPLWPYQEVANEIIVFLIDEASNSEGYHGNKIFNILEFFLFFISVPSFT